MPVTFISNGYDTTVDKPYGEAVWADAHPSIGSARYGVRSPLDWKVTAVAGQDRTVSINAGRGFGHGVTDKTVENDTLQLATITSGSRWDLIVARRDWTPTAGVTKFEKIAGGTTAAIPGGRLVGPGNIDDQPLALVQVTAGQTQPTAIIDLRTWSGDGGGLIAADDLVRSFMNSVGTRLVINGTSWVRRVGANDTPEWVDENGSGPWVNMTPNFSWIAVAGSTPRCRLLDGGRFLHIQGELLYTAGDTPQETWTVANIPAGMRPTEVSFIPGTTDTYSRGTVYVVGPDGTIRNGPKPAGKVAQFNGVVPLK